MKITFITREGYSQPGARMRSYGLSDQLKKRGLESEVFSFADHLGAKAGRDEADFSLYEKIRYAGKGFSRLIKKSKSVFIINRMNYHAMPAFLAAKLKRAPFIFDMDDWEAREDITHYLKVFPRSKAEGITRFMAKRARVCIAASRYLMDYLSQFNKNVHYLPTGVNLDVFRFKPLPDKGNFVFSWHGSVNRREILEYINFLIESFRPIREKYDFVKLWIVADGIYGRELRRMIEGCGLPGLEYKGWIEPDDVPRYLEGVSAGLVPLLHNSKFNLSKSPVKLAEYMAMGRPVVASPLGEARYMVKNGYNGFLARDRDEFIYSMERLSNDLSLARAMGINGRECVEKNYSLEKEGQKLYQIILDNFA